MSGTSSFPSCLSLNVDKVVGVNRFALFMSILLMLLILSLNVPIFLSLYRDVSTTSFDNKQFSKLLLTLVAWNLGTGILVDTSFIVKTTAELMKKYLSVSCTAGDVTFISAGTVSLISFATLTAIAAQMYCRVLNCSRSRSRSAISAIVAVGGVLATVAGLMSLITKAAQFVVDLLVSIIFVVVAARLFALCKIAIRRSRRGRRNRLISYIQGVKKGPKKLLKRQKKINAMVCLLRVFVLTHMPLLISLIILAWKEHEEESIDSMSAQRFSIVAYSFCSTLTAVIILWKLEDIRRDFKSFYRSLFNGRSSTHTSRAMVSFRHGQDWVTIHTRV